MPRVTIAPENRVGDPEDKFPRLKLKVDERKRIWCPPDPPASGTHQPWREWVHQIKAPVIEHGEAKKETRKRQDGSTYETYETTFIAAPICLGDLGRLMEKSVDEVNCPDCEAAVKLGKAAFKPQVRYASPIIAYSTKPGGWELASPFGAQILIWSYPAGRYGKLVDLAQAEGRDLCMFDLRLGPCEPPENFQKYDIQALGSRQMGWATSPATKAYIGELWTTPGNQPTEEQLQAACGKMTERAYMIEDLNRAIQLWDRAEHAGAAATVGAEFGQQSGNLTEGLNNLLDGLGAGHVNPAAPQGQALAQAMAPDMAALAAQQQAALSQAVANGGQVLQEPVAASADAFSGLLGGGDPAGVSMSDIAPAAGTEPAAPTQDPFTGLGGAADPAAQAAAAPVEEVDFTKLLGGLG